MMSQGKTPCKDSRGGFRGVCGVFPGGRCLGKTPQTPVIPRGSFLEVFPRGSFPWTSSTVQSVPQNTHSWTSKLDWRYFEANKIIRNELQIRTNSHKGIRTKMAETLKNFEKSWRKKNQPCFQPETSWRHALDHLAIGLVANKNTSLKQVKIC